MRCVRRIFPFIFICLFVGVCVIIVAATLTPMAKEEHVEAYVQALHKEIDLVAKHIDKSRRISQIHYGGGSPTAMPVSVLKELNEHLLSLFLR